MNICVYGASNEKIDKSFLEISEKFGKDIAKNGYGLVFGAGKYGVMGAVSRGVSAENGDIIGIVPEFFKDQGVLTDKCTQMIYTQTMRERKGIMEDKSGAFVMLPGGIGTFDEFFEIITLKQLKRHTKPIVIYNINNYFDSLIAMLNTAVEENFISKNCHMLYQVCSSSEEVFEYLKNYKPFTYDKYTELRG